MIAKNLLFNLVLKSLDLVPSLKSHKHSRQVDCFRNNIRLKHFSLQILHISMDSSTWLTHFVCHCGLVGNIFFVRISFRCCTFPPKRNEQMIPLSPPSPIHLPNCLFPSRAILLLRLPLSPTFPQFQFFVPTIIWSAKGKVHSQSAVGRVPTNCGQNEAWQQCCGDGGFALLIRAGRRNFSTKCRLGR